MSREIRISIDDDEVFERLKRRKEELDLSWAEALRRGLDRPVEGATERRSFDTPPGTSEARHDRDRGTDRTRDRGRGRRRGHRDSVGARRRERSPDHGPLGVDFGDRLERRINAAVEESLGAVEASLDAVGESIGSGISDLDAEIDRLEDAEDAILTFPFLEDTAASVPLRVTLETTPSDLDVEVVAVRRGKGTEDLNRFADDQRATVTQRLLEGEGATLELQGGAERYEVVPRLSWSRDADGTPVVSTVEIDRVRFDSE